MSKKRYINDNIREDTYIMDLDPSEKLLFIYLLTNSKVSLCGIYELHIRKIEVELWFEKELLNRMFLRFEKEEKIYYRDWYVFICNFIKNQSMNDNMKKWVKREISELWKEKLVRFNNLKGFERLRKALESFGILNLTSLNLTLPNLTAENGEEKIEENTELSQYDIVEEQEVEDNEEQDIDSLFEEFWKLYPNKKWKGKAKKSFEIALRKTTLEKIMDSLHKNIAEIDYKKRTWQFAPEYPHPTTWLNQERWDDEYSTIEPDKPKTDDDLVHEYDELKNWPDRWKALAIMKERYWDEKAYKIHYKRSDFVTDRILYK